MALFNLKKYQRMLHTQWLGQNVSYFKELDSTNTYLKQLKSDDVSHGQVCLTDCQTQGRGQYERKWETESGKNLTFTLAFKPPESERFNILALACARAAVDQIEDSFGCEAFIKWPNDVIIEGKKVAGLLTETMFNGNSLDRLLIGIGLNVNQEHFSDALQEKAISLKQLAGRSIDREDLLCSYLSRVEYFYMYWHKQNHDLLKAINKKIIGYGQWVHLQVNGQPSTEAYKLLGINRKGELTAVSNEGDLETFTYEQIRLLID